MFKKQPLCYVTELVWHTETVNGRSEIVYKIGGRRKVKMALRKQANGIRGKMW